VQTTEPWRINKEDLYFRIIMGWSLESFNEWLIKTSKEYGLSTENLLLGIVETIRKISYRTIKILEWQTKIRNKVQIPPFIITLKLKSYITAISSQLENGQSFDDLCNKKEFLSVLGLFGQITLELEGVREISRAINEGVEVCGMASAFLTVYNQFVVQKAFEEFLKTNKNLQSPKNSFVSPICDHDFLIKIIAEETMHYFDYWTNPQMMKNLFEMVREKSKGTKDPEKILDIEQKAENELGLKDRAEQIFLILKNQDDLFSPLKEKLCKV
jgi:hypothetical protein